MAIRNIRTVGDECLTKICKEVKEVNERTKLLIEDMIDTMYEANGVGLAAPQVGVLKRIVVIDVGEGPIVMINQAVSRQVMRDVSQFREKQELLQDQIM